MAKRLRRQRHSVQLVIVVRLQESGVIGGANLISRGQVRRDSATQRRMSTLV